MAIATFNDNIGGYSYDFICTLHDRFVCKICHFPSRDSYLSVCCGHGFCKSCLDNLKKTAAITYTCPVCRDEEFVTFPNKQADREIKSLHIYCTNKEEGCEWQGALNSICSHLGNSDGCQFEALKCSNECGKMIQRQYFTCHVETECPRRKIDCLYCHDTGEHQFIEGQHKEECPKLPLPCPNQCEIGSIPREDMEAHRKECPLEMIQCEYHDVGCEVKVARQDQMKHNQELMEDHLMMTKNDLTGTKAQLNIVSKQLNDLVSIWRIILDIMATVVKKSGHQICPITIKMSEFNSKNEDRVLWYSDSFYTHNKGYKMCLRIDAAGYGKGKDTHLSVFLYLMKGPHDDELTWPLKGKFEIKLFNQISDSEHYSKTVTYDDDDGVARVTEGDRAKNGWGHQQFICNEQKIMITPTCQYLKDDSLFFEVTKL